MHGRMFSIISGLYPQDASSSSPSSDSRMSPDIASSPLYFHWCGVSSCKYRMLPELLTPADLPWSESGMFKVMPFIQCTFTECLPDPRLDVGKKEKTKTRSWYLS